MLRRDISLEVLVETWLKRDEFGQWWKVVHLLCRQGTLHSFTLNIPLPDDLMWSLFPWPGLPSWLLWPQATLPSPPAFLLPWVSKVALRQHHCQKNKNSKHRPSGVDTGSEVFLGRSSRMVESGDVSSSLHSKIQSSPFSPDPHPVGWGSN